MGDNNLLSTAPDIVRKQYHQEHMINFQTNQEHSMEAFRFTYPLLIQTFFYFIFCARVCDQALACVCASGVTMGDNNLLSLKIW